MPEDDLELRSKVNLFTFGNIAGFIGESSPHQTSLSENRMKKNNSHHSNVDELLESVSGDFFQRHVRQPSVGRMKSPRKDQGELTVMRSRVTYSLATTLAAALEAS